jgi:hypothetical protein
VIATPKALLLRFVMAEPAAELVAHELRRDADLSNDDRIAFVLDTYQDRRNAYFFATNPNGAREDGLVTEEGDPSLDWDTVWDVRVRRTSSGWDALFRIPYTALNFPGGEGGVWGFNFSRILRRRTETVRWSGWKRPFALSKVSLAGDLIGLPALPSRRLRSLTPYAAARIEQLQGPSDSNLLAKCGLDFRYGISSSTEADFTANTDFAEAETDTQQFNFGRTALFFPEKRLFFLQRSQIFAFGSSSSTLPFFSRRIGLKTNNEAIPIPIDAGLKLTGRVGLADFGGPGGPDSLGLWRAENRLPRRSGKTRPRARLLRRRALHRRRAFRLGTVCAALEDLRRRHRSFADARVERERLLFQDRQPRSQERDFRLERNTRLQRGVCPGAHRAYEHRQLLRSSDGLRQPERHSR